MKVAALAHRMPALLAAPPAADGRLCLTNARLLDGAHAAVLIEEGRIACVGDGTPEGAHIVDLEGKTLLPGLIDAHIHLYARTPEPAQGAEPSDASTHEVSQGAGADGSRSTGCRHPC